MEEQLISFETAILAKNKGFNERCYVYFYTDRYERELGMRLCNYKSLHGVTNSTRNSDLIECAAPTQSLLQKWLRDKHNIIVTSDPITGFSKCKHSWHIYQFSNIWYLSKFTAVCYNSYEEALEVGLQEALKLI